MLIGDKRIPKVRRSMVVLFATPFISYVRRLVRTSLLQAVRWNSRLDGLRSLSILGTALRISTIDDISELSPPQETAIRQLSVERTIQSA